MKVDRKPVKQLLIYILVYVNACFLELDLHDWRLIELLCRKLARELSSN